MKMELEDLVELNGDMVPVSEGTLVFVNNDQLMMPRPSNELNINDDAKKPTKTKAGLVSDRGYICQFCSLPFTNSSNLKAHVRTHTGEKPYECKQCGKRFIQSSNLRAHMRTHSGERPFECKICGHRFSRSSHLAGHKRTHTGEKPYVCGTCNEKFATSTHLRNHVKKHIAATPYNCGLCEVDFQHFSQLQAHVKTHVPERPYKCADCPGAFRSKADLKSHRKLHVDEEPYICGICYKTFKTCDVKDRHMSDLHNIAPSTKNKGIPLISTKTETDDTDQYANIELVDEFGNTYSLGDFNCGDVTTPKNATSSTVIATTTENISYSLNHIISQQELVIPAVDSTEMSGIDISDLVLNSDGLIQSSNIQDN